MNARGAVTNDESRDKGDRVAVCFRVRRGSYILSLYTNRAASAIQPCVSPKANPLPLSPPQDAKSNKLAPPPIARSTLHARYIFPRSPVIKPSCLVLEKRKRFLRTSAKPAGYCRTACFTYGACMYICVCVCVYVCVCGSVDVWVYVLDTRKIYKRTRERSTRRLFNRSAKEDRLIDRPLIRPRIVQAA